MITKKKSIALALYAVLFALHSAAQAQQPKKIPRIGFLGAISPSAASARTEAFRQGLRELGCVEGKTSSLKLDTRTR
jgi:putative tryptophan/tyrosine transport system substrate-binding protein